jgi:hypothetical protein
MVVIIAFLAIAGKAFSNWLKHRDEKGRPVKDDRLERLEERVRVLERIVTDSGYDLHRQFRDLERDA